MTRTIEIIAKPDGTTSVQTRGFAGSSCREASKFIEEALGKRTGEQLTAEFRQSESVRQARQQRSYSGIDVGPDRVTDRQFQKGPGCDPCRTRNCWPTLLNERARQVGAASTPSLVA